MKKLMSIYLCLFLIMFPIVGFSQEDPTSGSKKITVDLLNENLIEWEGVKYIIIDEDTATIFFDRYNKYPKLELKVKTLSELVTLYSEQLVVNTKINANLGEQNSFLLDQVAGLEKKLDKPDPWYESWWFLMGLGFICGTGLTIGIMKLVKEI